MGTVYNQKDGNKNRVSWLIILVDYYYLCLKYLMA